MILILMGVSGSGKTTVGRVLARDLSWPFFDGDDFHAPASIDRMRRGLPLTDADRAPWLEALRAHIAGLLAAGQSAVVACSALREVYRRRLQVDPAAVHFVYLRGSPGLIRDRLAARSGHFMPADLLDSQLAALEEPADALAVTVDDPPETVARIIRAALGL